MYLMDPKKSIFYKKNNLKANARKTKKTQRFIASSLKKDMKVCLD